MQQEAIELLQKVDADKLPSLPCVLLHLLDACQDENVSFEQLANVIRMDPGLYIKVIAATKGGFSSKDSLEQHRPICQLLVEDEGCKHEHILDPLPGSQCSEQAVDVGQKKLHCTHPRNDRECTDDTRFWLIRQLSGFDALARGAGHSLQVKV